MELVYKIGWRDWILVAGVYRCMLHRPMPIPCIPLTTCFWLTLHPGMTSVDGSIRFPEMNSVRWRCRCPRTRRCARWCSWSRYPGHLLERCWGGFSRTLLLLLTLLLVRQVIPPPSAIRDCNRSPHAATKILLVKQHRRCRLFIWKLLPWLEVERRQGPYGRVYSYCTVVVLSDLWANGTNKMMFFFY